MNKKILSIALVLCMILSCMAVNCFTVSAQSVETAGAAAGEDYGLGDSCTDGNILHCFNWTLAQIKAELPNIAAAGFTSVQTSPLQGHDGRNKWSWLYQPTGFTIGNELGSYDDLKSLCTEADKYGIKVIVDVVANHLAGNNYGTWAYSVESSLKKSEYFHNEGPCENFNDRYEVTHKNIGMPDLNTENETIQNLVAAMVTKLKDAGVDGIRWDAAKHIGLPSEGSSFWEKTTNTGVFHYAEILEAPAGKSSESYNNQLMAEYAKYMNVTDDTYGATITTAVRDGRVAKSNGNWNRRGIDAGQLVYWAESHDTYANNGWTNGLDQNVIDRAYAILGARAESQSLYLSRPFEKSDSAITYATKGSTHFTSKEVAAVNHFHNAMIGTEERYSTSAGCFVVCREGGAVIVSPKGSDIDVSVTNSGGMVPTGTYTDEVSGSTWTVTETTISGHIGDTGIAVIYDTDKLVKELLAGDADLSGEITVIDATEIQRYLASMCTLNADATAVADVDGDGSVTIVDATAIQRWLAGLEDGDSPIGKPLNKT